MKISDFMCQYFGRGVFCYAAALAIVVLGVVPAPVSAQGHYWIQIESQPDIRNSKFRAQNYAARFGDTRAFLTTTGWYAIVVGPMGRDLAIHTMATMKDAGQIPADAFVSDGSTHLGQLWPLAANANLTVAEQSNVVVIEEPTVSEETPAIEAEVNVEVEVEAEAPAVPEPAPVLIADDDLNGTKALERSWTRAEKMEYQEYLAWTGDYKSAIDGAYGRGTRGAIRAFQEREGFQPTGYMTQVQLDLLVSSYADFLSDMGVALLRDLDAGIELMAPTALVEFERFEPPFVMYAAKNGSRVQVLLISQPGDRPTLTSLHDIMETLDYVASDVKNTKKRDWFEMAGQGEFSASYTYARLKNGLIKGFTLIWGVDVERDMPTVAKIMRDSFTPVDDYVLDETLGFGAGEDEAIDLLAGTNTVLADRLSSGFVISQNGVILTHMSAVAECRRISLGDEVDLRVIAQSPALELAVLRPKSAYTPASFALFSDENPEVGNDITVAGFSYPREMETASLSFGILSGKTGLNGKAGQIRLNVNLANGDAGGPVMDDRGAVIGMQRLQLEQDNPLPDYVNFATKSAGIMALLDRHEITYGRSTAFESVAPEDLMDMAGDFTVKVSCWN